MKYLKTTITNLLIAIASLFMVSSAVYAQQVTLDFDDSIAGRPGEAFSIPVSADFGSLEVGNLDFTIEFDSSAVNITKDDIVFGDLVSQIGPIVGPEDVTNTIYISGSSTDTPITGETVLFTINGTFDNSGTYSPGIEMTNINLGNNLTTNVSTPAGIDVTIISDTAIELPDINGTVNETGEATITTDDLSALNISSYELTFTYDPSVISIGDVNTEGTVTGSPSPIFSASSGTVNISWAGNSDLSSGTDLLNIEYNLLSATTGSPLTFTNITFYNNVGDQVSVLGLEGSVSVEGAIGSFSLLSPANGTSLTVEEGSDTEVVIDWEDALNAESYRWVAKTSSGDFLQPLLDFPADSNGIKSMLTLTAGAIDNILDGAGVEKGDGITLQWTVFGDTTAYDEKQASQVWEITLNRAVETFEVNFNVVMRLDNSFDPNTENLYLSGSFAGWAVPGEVADYKMTEDSKDDQRYSYTIELAAGEYNYKYFKVEEGQTGWGGEEWAGDPNRTVTVNGPTTVNELFGVQPGETISMSDARNVLVEGDPAPVQGIVTTPDYGFSVNNFYIQDANAGLAAVGFSFPANNDTEGSNFESGQELMIMGEMGSYNDQVQIEVQSYQVVSSGNTLPDPILITSTDQWTVDSQYQGMRVTLENMYLPQDSEWPMDGISSGSGLTTSIVGNLEQTADTFLVRIDRDESFFDGSQRPQGDFNMSGVMGRFRSDVQLYPFFESELAMATTNEPTEPTNLPSAFKLEQNYPNPFNPTTNIVYSLPEASDVTLEVYNALGQKVSTLVNTRMSAGNHTVKFDAGNLTSGVYFARIKAGNFVTTKKMLLLK